MKVHEKNVYFFKIPTVQPFRLSIPTVVLFSLLGVLSSGLSPVQGKPCRTGPGQPQPCAHLPDLFHRDQGPGGHPWGDAQEPDRVPG